MLDIRHVQVLKLTFLVDTSLSYGERVMIMSRFTSRSKKKLPTVGMTI